MKLPLVLTSAALAGCTSMPDPCKPVFIIPTLTSLAITGAVLAGCAALPNNNAPSTTAVVAVVEANSALAVDKEIPPMSRQEVIHGISECEKANMRPYVITTRRKVNNQLIPAVVEITCLPISK
jgi:hypothetical protein